MKTCQVLAGNASIGELTYLVPPALEESIGVGQTVIVPLGNRIAEGLVTGFDPAPEGLELKEIVSITSQTRLFNVETLETSLVADALSFTKTGTHLSNTLWKPPSVRVERRISVIGDAPNLKPSESALLDAIIWLGEDATLGALNKKVGKSKTTAPLRGLIEKGVVRIEDAVISTKARIREHFEVQSDDLDSNREIATKHDTVAGLSRETGISPARINKMIKLGQLAKVADALPKAPEKLDPPGFKVTYHEGLSPDQRINLYANWAKELLGQDRSMIVVAPTVFAAERIYQSLSKSVPCNICTGGMNDSESHDLKTILETGINAIVIGLAGAVMLPLPNCSIVAVDEPLSPMFESDVPYELRLTNLARLRAQRSNCQLALCGAPSTLEGKLEGLETSNLPVRVDIVNMAFEIGSGEQILVSEGLVQAVNDEVKAGRPTVIMLNRKGYSNFVYCDECGEVLKCPKCQIPLTYYTRDNSISCRFCGFKGQAPDTCPSCDSIFIRFKAGGTERLWLELSKRLLAGRILFAEGGLKDSAKNLKSFGKPGDVLVSTTMMLDRADLSNVRLISVASLDGILSMPIFSATHKAYALASILASRLPQDGRLLIQTYMSHHPFFKHLREKTLGKFLDTELDDRREAVYPPFTQILWWHVVGKDQLKSSRDAMLVAGKLRDHLGPDAVTGPNAGYFHRLKGEYRWDILLRMREIPTKLETLIHLYQNLCSNGIKIEVTNPNI
jgi:primosomal protein N' (replication factor Y)